MMGRSSSAKRRLRAEYPRPKRVAVDNNETRRVSSASVAVESRASRKAAAIDRDSVQGRSARIRRVRQLAGRRAVLEADLRLAVAQACASGYSWADIGAALGVSRQAARQRYGLPSV